MKPSDKVPGGLGRVKESTFSVIPAVNHLFGFEVPEGGETDSQSVKSNGKRIENAHEVLKLTMSNWQSV